MNAVKNEGSSVTADPEDLAAEAYQLCEQAFAKQLPGGIYTHQDKLHTRIVTLAHLAEPETQLSRFDALEPPSFQLKLQLSTTEAERYLIEQEDRRHSISSLGIEPISDHDRHRVVEILRAAHSTETPS